MAKFKVGCSPLTSKIFAGNVSERNVYTGKKYDVTDTAPSAVAQHLLQLNQSMEFTYEGEQYELTVIKLPKKKVKG